MYLNIGGDMAVRDKTIIGIFDLDNTSMSAKTREFLGNAEKATVTVPKSTKPLLSVEKVVAKCIKASLRGRSMCVTNWYTKMQHVLFKILPDSILSRAWLGMLKHPEESEK